MNARGGKKEKEETGESGAEKREREIWRGARGREREEKKGRKERERESGRYAGATRKTGQKTRRKRE